MQVQDWLAQAAKQLEREDNPRAEARWLLAAVLDKPADWPIINANAALSDNDLANANQWLAKRGHGMPLAYLRGWQEFWGLKFSVNPHTLIPRADSETLIEAVLARYPDRAQPLAILELGTGSGCLLLSLLHNYPNAHGIGTDISLEAVQTARGNAVALGLQKRSQWLVGDWAAAIDQPFDLVISNPPYIGRDEVLPRTVARFEPVTALYADDHGMAAYTAILAQLPYMLKPQARAFLESGGQVMEKLIERLAISDQWRTITHNDIAERPRIIEICK